MFLSLPLALLSALEDYLGDVSASYFEFWGACWEALATTDLRDL